VGTIIKSIEEIPAPQRTLIVEDDENDQFLMGTRLNNLHTVIDYVTNLEGAYSLVRENKPDIILLDVNIPARATGGGIASLGDILTFIRFHRDRHCLVIVTGSSETNDVSIQEFYLAGAMDYIGKEKLAVDQELCNRVREAFKLHCLFKGESATAQFMLQVSLVRSNQDRLFNMFRIVRDNIGKVREDEITLIRQQSFKAGQEAKEREIDLNRKKRLLRNRAAAIGGASAFFWTAWEMIRAFWDGFKHAKD
jgi:CheY-like chemotaxis protein